LVGLVRDHLCGRVDEREASIHCQFDAPFDADPLTVLDRGKRQSRWFSSKAGGFAEWLPAPHQALRNSSGAIFAAACRASSDRT